jgi:reactive intermediate/imine deaminase
MNRALQVVQLMALSTGILMSQTSRQVVPTDVPLPFSAAVRAGDFVYLGGELATRLDDGMAIVPGGIQAQTRRVLERLSATLEKAGSSLANAASVTVYLSKASDFQAMNEVYRTYWKTDPPARTTVVSDFVLPGALIEISMVAIVNGAERVVVHPAAWAKSPNPYSYGIKSGNTLFLAGLVSRDVTTNRAVAGDMATQTKQALANGRQILEAAGMSLADVVSSRVYITDTGAFQAMNAVYRDHFPASPPARATVQAGLMAPESLVEITMTGVRDSSRRAITTPAADGRPGQANPVLSSAIQVGNRLYLSGMLGNTAATAGNAGAQTGEALARLGRTLTAAGFDWSHVVDGVVYLPDLSHYGAMNEAYRSVFPKDFPARAAVRAGLVAPGGLVEVMLTAVK